MNTIKQNRKILLTVLMLLVSVVAAWADKYEPNTKWPYIYEDFTTATIYFDGNKKSEVKGNVHLQACTLHYLGEDNKVYEYATTRLMRVEIGEDVYLPINQKLMLCTYSSGSNMVLKSQRPNYAAIKQNNGAYGATTNSASTRELSSIELAGNGNPEHGKMLLEKKDGVFLPVITEYFLHVDGKTIEAEKKAVEQFLGSERADEWKAFMKANKIKWKNPDDLAKVLDFLKK